MGVWELGNLSLKSFSPCFRTPLLSLFFSVGMAALRPWLGTFLRSSFSPCPNHLCRASTHVNPFFALSGAVAKGLLLGCPHSFILKLAFVVRRLGLRVRTLPQVMPSTIYPPPKGPTKIGKEKETEGKNLS